MILTDDKSCRSKNFVLSGLVKSKLKDSPQYITIPFLKEYHRHRNEMVLQ